MSVCCYFVAAIHCGDPGILPDSSRQPVNMTDINDTPDNTVIYTCISTKRFKDGSENKTSMCIRNGTWTLLNDSCEGIFYLKII